MDWNGKNYQPYVVTSNQAVGKVGNGYTKLSACSAAVEASSYEHICQWNGDGYGVFDAYEPSTPVRLY